MQNYASVVGWCSSGGRIKSDAVGTVLEHFEANVFEEFMTIAGVGSELKSIECDATSNIEN